MRVCLRFFGAVREVTGSMHVIEANGYTIAMDCGLHQGRRAESNEKNRSFPCAADKVSAVLLSHAHIDHCGKLPRLVREGFSGPIYVTPPTRDLTEILLYDSAHIQQEDAAYWNKKRVKHGDAPIEPLYTALDVEQTVSLMQSRQLGEVFEVVSGIRASFHEAGHMLGSACIHSRVANGSREPITVTYTGDLGRPGMAILKDPAPLPSCDYLICESTYGGRESDDPEPMPDKLARIINETIEHDGKVIIPAFAVGRTQVIVYHLHQLLHQGKISRHVPIIVDSPLAVRATEIFKKHPEAFDKEATDFNHATGSILDCSTCEYVENVERSKALHDRPGPMIIISASGMCEVGRILHHLKNNIESPRNTILIVGYQAENTLGRRLVDKAKHVRIFGEMYQVRARVKTFNGFSSHADAEELLAMTLPLASQARKVFLVHGEIDQSQKLASTMRERGFRDVVIPQRDQCFEVFP